MLHELENREWRNGWEYRQCSCGVLLGPFANEDYASDAFELHQLGHDKWVGELIANVHVELLGKTFPESAYELREQA